MPTYRYRCSDCRHEFDQIQKFSEDALTICPSCTGPIRRVIQPVGVVFKGSGWYITDSRKSDSAPSSNGKKPESTDRAESNGKAAAADAAEKPVKAEAKESAPAEKAAAAKPAAASA